MTDRWEARVKLVEARARLAALALDGGCDSLLGHDPADLAWLCEQGARAHRLLTDAHLARQAAERQLAEAERALAAWKGARS